MKSKGCTTELHRRRFTVSQLLLAVAAVAIVFGVVRVCIVIIEAERRRVHPSEQQVADRVRGLGGTYRAEGKDDFQIKLVWLANTPTTDADMKMIMSLPLLIHLDIRGTQVTDQSVDAIFAHPKLKSIRVSGSRISQGRLSAATQASDYRIDVEE